MTEGQPVHWGNIGAETAKSAAALLEKGETIEMKRFPFDNIAVGEDLEAVKKEVEQVRQAHPLELQGTDTCAQKMRDQAIAWGKANVALIWGKTNVTKEFSGKVPGARLGATPGFVVLSDVGNLPWGSAGERGGIYTWQGELLWTMEPGCFVLTFSCKEEN